MALKTGDAETGFAVRSRDADMSVEEYRALPKHPIYIVLENLRSAFNVGAIFRLCDTMRVAGLFLCGYTASPPHVKLEKTSLGTVRFVPWEKFDTALEAVRHLKERGVEVWGAETTSHSIIYYEAVVPPKVAVVFGNEALGVSSGVLDICDRLIEIPAYGFKNSLNVATACSVIGYRILESMNNKKARN